MAVCPGENGPCVRANWPSNHSLFFFLPEMSQWFINKLPIPSDPRITATTGWCTSVRRVKRLHWEKRQEGMVLPPLLQPINQVANTLHSPATKGINFTKIRRDYWEKENMGKIHNPYSNLSNPSYVVVILLLLLTCFVDYYTISKPCKTYLRRSDTTPHPTSNA